MPGIAQRINNNTSGDNNDVNTGYQNPLVGNGTLPFHSFNGSSVSSNGFWSQHRDDVSYNQLQKFWCELTPQARQNLLRIDKQTLFEHARFLQIVMYGKSLQQDAGGGPFSVRATDNQNDGDLCMANGCQDDAQDPSVHPWGGLTTARDMTLTLLDCYLYSKSLKGLQNVFDSARARERERELLYPDACGGGGRGWISQGIAGYGRGHGTRETCALHTARLSVETLVDFWFDSKRFCRDCRRNVIREFKELKELKRMRRETRCTTWFCVADTAFQYEVFSRDTVQADWHQTFSDAFGTYHHFEWAIGTGEGKSDILEFENVGLSGSVQVNGLDLSGLNACYITLRAWKMDGRCNELCVKAHALRGQQCVHCRLVVGDGFVTITRGESITRFFEHAEEAEEEEDDDSMDKDGNELDGECSRPQKHAKSPELAREFLLDAATVIFKEQACDPVVTDVSKEESTPSVDEGVNIVSSIDTVSERGEATPSSPLSPDIQEDPLLTEFTYSNMENPPEDILDGEFGNTRDWNTSFPYDHLKYSRRKLKFRKDSQWDLNLKWSDRRKAAALSENGVIVSKYESRYHADGFESTRSINGYNKQLRTNAAKSNIRSGSKLSEKFQCTNNRIGERYDSHSCSCNHHPEYRSRPESHITRVVRDPKYVNKLESPSDILKPYYRGKKYTQVECAREINGRPKSKIIVGNPPNTKKVWEPLDSQKKCCCSTSSDEVTDVSVQTNQEDNDARDLTRCRAENCRDIDNGFHTMEKPRNYSKEAVAEDGELCSMTRSPLGTLDSSMSSSSNSDNCSSCLSEGDSNMYSNPQNLESTSTSDSEESSQNSEGRETSQCLENAITASHRVVENQSTSRGKDANSQGPASAGTNSLGGLPKEAAPYCENGRANVSIGTQPQCVLPQLHNKNINYPVFQAPTMGYYHQNPVSWPAGPTNGLMSFPHSNHYLFANTLGYGLNRNARFMQYGALQHLAPPLLIMLMCLFSSHIRKVASTDQHPAETPIVVDAGQNGKPDKMDMGNNGFSLFHFGGPVALSTGFKADPVSLNEGIMGSTSLNSSANCPDGDHSCSKKDSIEEYNLFAATNGIKFSIF
ncbi:hypothetical protein Pfo_028165 [Paulownia fortunei]|nr:hypothetical protein Pfo_028165 [Paulownia fortunei]